jgi:hypothetical protein
MKKEHLFKETTINILKKYGCLYMADDYTDMLLEIEQQQGYSEEDMKEYAEFCVAKFNKFESVSLNDEYFKQFKKK